ncbi:hypothetical protein SprV_0200777400 [Sparganum proliferum]
MRIRLHPRKRPQGRRLPGKLDIALLSLPAHHLHFSSELAQRLDNLPVAAAAGAADENASVEKRWCQLRDTVQSTALDVIGHRDWYGDNDAAISNLLAEKNRLRKAYVDSLTDAKKAAFYRTAYGPPTKATAPTLGSNGSTLLTEKVKILHRWAEIFRGVLSPSSTFSDAAIARLPQVETNVDLYLSPSLHEVIRAVRQLSNGRTPGLDAIPAETYKHGGPQLVDYLTALSQEMWRQGEFSQNSKDVRIAHLYKRKRNPEICDNHREIPPMDIAGKFLVSILLNRLNNHLHQDLLPESQCGFRRRT